jgi:Flp pilus assembly pilin Flp
MRSWTAIRGYASNTSGVTAIEYALIASATGLALAGVLGGIGGGLSGKLQAVMNAIASVL